MSFKSLPTLDLPASREVPTIGVQWPINGKQYQCNGCTFVFKRGGPNGTMEHANKAHKRQRICEDYCRLLPMPYNFGCGHRFKHSASQKCAASHCLVCPSRLGNFDPIAAEDIHADKRRQMEDEMDKVPNFYDVFSNVAMKECRH